MGVEVQESARNDLLRGKFAIWHLHWPEKVLNTTERMRACSSVIKLLTLLACAHLRGTKIMWTVHNLESHDQRFPRLERFFFRQFVRFVDGFFVLSASGKELVIDRFPQLDRIPSFVVPHGHYRSVYPAEMGRSEARTRLGLAGNTRIVCFLGRIRPYKQVISLVQAFHKLSDPDLLLLIAGEPGSTQHADAIHGAASNSPRVHLALRFIPDEEIQVYLHASDLVVLPYREILNSGTAILALSFNRPVLVPQKGAMGDLERDLGPAWVRTYPAELTGECLASALQWATAPNRPKHAPLDRLEWDAIAQQTLYAYREISG